MASTEKYDRSTLPSQSPRLCYFISRSNGNIIPLIPADELPYSVKLMGVPRAMKMEQSCGMHHVGTHPFTGQYFKLEPGVSQQSAARTDVYLMNRDSSKQTFTATDAVLCQNEQGKPTTEIHPRTDQVASRLPVSATASNWRKTEDPASARSQVIIDNIVAQGSRSPIRQPQAALKASRIPAFPPGSSSEQRDKIYCSYWVRSGECDYTQQGCRYKHEMPDKRTLASIGFRTVPRWWQDKTAIQLGQSAIPTVGSAMKPAEWLKQRMSSDDSQSDEEDRSELDSEAGDGEESDADAVPAAKSGRQLSATAMSPAAEKSDEMAVLKPERKEECSEKINTQALTTTTPVTVSEPCQSLTDGDLIDLSPMSPTQTISCTSDDTATPNIVGVAKLCPDTTPMLSLYNTERKQTAPPPRKVFVQLANQQHSTSQMPANTQKCRKQSRNPPSRQRSAILETPTLRRNRRRLQSQLPSAPVPTLDSSLQCTLHDLSADSHCAATALRVQGNCNHSLQLAVLC